VEYSFFAEKISQIVAEGDILLRVLTFIARDGKFTLSSAREIDSNFLGFILE
jgi:hypothetical protein